VIPICGGCLTSGLGKATQAESVEITWPRGQRETLKNLVSLRVGSFSKHWSFPRKRESSLKTAHLARIAE
jgi:hypothetical protein